MRLHLSLFLTTALLLSGTLNSFAGKFEEEFNELAKTTPQLIEAKKFVETEQHVYEGFTLNETTFQLLALHQTLGNKVGNFSTSLNNWRTTSGYKNFPDVKTDSDVVVRFSAHHKPTITYINNLLKPLHEQDGDLYEMIKGNPEPLSILQTYKNSVIVLDQVEKTIKNLITLDKFKEQYLEEKKEISEEKEDKLQKFLEGDFMELVVLNMTKDISEKSHQDISDREYYSKEILKAFDFKNINGADETWRNNEKFIKKIEEILQDNFS